jgi:DNA-binding transcriptional MocR family regulator
LRRQLEQRQLAMRHAIIREFPPQVCVSQPAGGYFLWLDLGDNVDAARVYQRALAKGVSVAPGTMFSADERFRHCLRLNTSFEWGPHTARAISVLAALVAEEVKG